MVPKPLVFLNGFHMIFPGFSHEARPFQAKNVQKPAVFLYEITISRPTAPLSVSPKGVARIGRHRQHLELRQL